MEQRSLAGWISFEHWVLRAMTHAASAVWHALPGGHPVGGPATAQGRRTPAPSIAWHPHRDVLATLSPAGTVAVHCLGDVFSGSTTQYLHMDSSHGFALCLAWQPNNVCGALALGMSSGVALFRHSRNEGWWRGWSMHGEPFACPAVTWSPDGRCLATAGARGIVRVWPHGALFSDQPTPWCVTLRRWRSSGPVASLQWAPDGTILAVAHTGSTPLIRLWDTRSWEITVHIGLEQLLGADARQSPSLAWCSNEALLGSAGGRLFELCGVGVGQPSARAVSTPQLGEARQAVLELAVCPRTQQRVALLLEAEARVLVFERLAGEAWARQELVLRGLVAAAGAQGPEAPRPRALAFAAGPRRRQGAGPFEASLLAVYWDLPGHAAEVRTYPMHYLPSKLVHSDAAVVSG